MPDNKPIRSVSMTKAIVGVIGGSGVYDLPGLTDLREERIDTPFGEPSDALRFGRIGDTQVVFLARHGRGHRFSPSGINYRANIYALKAAGVTDLISVSACGSFKPEFYPGLFVLVDQFVDRTFGRQSSFFGNGCVAHVSMAHPVAPLLQDRIEAAARAESIACHRGGTYVCMEGPAFSTIAESNLYRSWGANIIGMTNLTEAKLAREAEIAYATLALVTDYDCWHPDHDHVTVEMIIDNLHKNAINAQKVIQATVGKLAENPPSSVAHSALKYAILTPLAKAPEATKEKLALILQKYL
jgi:5'-methylthioadenosine phosphorylase